MAALHSVYDRSPVWLQNVLVTAYGLRVKRLRYGGLHEEALTRLRRSERFSRERMEAYQRSRLADLLESATSTVPHYRERLGRLDTNPDEAPDLLATLPILEKDAVRERPDRLVSDDPELRPTDWISTSGTTGTPLDVATRRDAIQENYAFFARFLGWAGVEPRGRSATFAGRPVVPATQEGPPFWRYNAAGRTLHFSAYHLGPPTAGSYVDALADFRPLYIDSYPSAIHVLARYILENDRVGDIRPAAVVTSSETLLSGQREDIEAAFGCKVWDHYGSAEMVAFITQCEAETYHVNPEFGLVEIVDEEGRPAPAGTVGDLVCTGFINPTMPFIRYRIGDTGSFGSKPCACGRPFPVIRALTGRRDDLIVTPNGRRIGRLDPVFKGARLVVEAQIAQTHVDRVEVRYVANASEDQLAEEIDLIRTNLHARLGPQMTLSFRRVESIPRTAAGKFRSVVSEIGPVADG